MDLKWGNIYISIVYLVFSSKMTNISTIVIETELRYVSLLKGRHTYVFYYRPSEEGKAIDDMVRMVKDPGNNFDAFDASLLSYQMGSGNYSVEQPLNKQKINTYHGK